MVYRGYTNDMWSVQANIGGGRFFEGADFYPDREVSLVDTVKSRILAYSRSISASLMTFAVQIVGWLLNPLLADNTLHSSKSEHAKICSKIGLFIHIQSNGRL